MYQIRPARGANMMGRSGPHDGSVRFGVYLAFLCGLREQCILFALPIVDATPNPGSWPGGEVGTSGEGKFKVTPWCWGSGVDDAAERGRS